MLHHSLSLTTVAVLLAALAATTTVRAEVIFSDNFDADSATSVVNFRSLINWDVGLLGTITYLRDDPACVGGSGGCLYMRSMDSGIAGIIVSKQIFNFVPGFNYFFEVTVSIGQPSGGSVALGFIGGRSELTLGSSDTGSYVFSFPTSGGANPGSSRLYIDGGIGTPSGLDYRGLIVDNAVLRREPTTTTVPEPSSLLLSAAALLGAAAVRRRNDR